MTYRRTPRSSYSRKVKRSRRGTSTPPSTRRRAAPRKSRRTWKTWKKISANVLKEISIADLSKPPSSVREFALQLIQADINSDEPVNFYYHSFDSDRPPKDQIVEVQKDFLAQTKKNAEKIQRDIQKGNLGDYSPTRNLIEKFAEELSGRVTDRSLRRYSTKTGMVAYTTKLPEWLKKGVEMVGLDKGLKKTSLKDLKSKVRSDEVKAINRILKTDMYVADARYPDKAKKLLRDLVKNWVSKSDAKKLVDKWVKVQGDKLYRHLKNGKRRVLDKVTERKGKKVYIYKTVPLWQADLQDAKQVAETDIDYALSRLDHIKRHYDWLNLQGRLAGKKPIALPKEVEEIRKKLRAIKKEANEEVFKAYDIPLHMKKIPKNLVGDAKTFLRSADFVVLKKGKLAGKPLKIIGSGYSSGPKGTESYFTAETLDGRRITVFTEKKGKRIPINYVIIKTPYRRLGRRTIGFDDIIKEVSSRMLRREDYSELLKLPTEQETKPKKSRSNSDPLLLNQPFLNYCRSLQQDTESSGFSHIEP